MSIYAFTLVEDDVKKIEIDEIRQGHKTVWVRAILPDESEVNLLTELTNAPVEEFKEFLEQDERPRLHVSRYLQIIFRSPITDNGDVRTVPVNIFINKNLIVTVEKEHISSLNKIEDLVNARKSRYLFKFNSCYFLYHIIDKINDEFLQNIDKISDSIDLFQSKGFSLSKENVEKIYEKSVTLTVFNQALISNIEVLNTLRKAYFKFLSDKNREQFNDLYYNALQVLDTEKIQRDVIANLFNLQAIISTSKLNNLIKRLTAITLIFMIPAAISGIYGMNFEHIPFSGSQHGFVIVTGIIVLIAALAFVLFKIGDWL